MYQVKIIPSLLLIVIFHLGFNFPVSGQASIPTINSPVPVSPNAASLGKYGETPIGYYTGIPDISIPLYDIQSGSNKVPVNLSYHAGGVKVEEVASWVGLGWALNAGGVITRQVRGIPDESPASGFLKSYTKIDSFINYTMSSLDDRLSYMLQLRDGTMDSEQDMFTYNLGGESGRFVFMPDRSVTTIPLTKIRFEFGNFLGQDSSWKVTGTDGTVYFFTNLETTYSANANGKVEGGPRSNLNSWYLTKIVNAVGSDTVSIDYDNTYTQFNSSIVQTIYGTDYSSGAPGGYKAMDDDYSVNSVTGKRIVQINFRNGSIHFYVDNSLTYGRPDYYLDYPLDSIVIKNTDNTYYKKYQFYQSFISSYTSSKASEETERKRMFLDSVVIFSASGRVGRYELTYDNSGQLPPRNSYDQDYWGFYNGINNGAYFAPSYHYPGSVASTYGATRTPNASVNQIGILKSISYPTGGHTDFEYETNTVRNLPAQMDPGGGYGYFNSTGSGSWTISDNYSGMGGVAATVSIGGGCTSGCPVVYLSTPYGSYGVTTSFTSFFALGNYSVSVDFTGVDPEVIDNFSFHVVWTKSAFSDTNFANNATAGGLRIKKITNYSADGAKAGVKKYTYKDKYIPGRSSGYLSSQGFPNIGNISIRGTDGVDYGYITISSGSHYPLLSTQGSCVGYKYVQEYLGENGEFGKNEYEFTAPDIYPDVVNADFPYPSSEVRDWKRGRLLHVEKYRYNASGSAYEPIEELTNYYDDHETNLYNGIKFGSNKFYPYDSPPGSNGTTLSYQNVTGWFPPISAYQTFYDQNNPSRLNETYTRYSYGDNHYEPISVITLNSKGDSVRVNMKYPLDFSGLTGSDDLSAGINNLKTRNIVSPVIEKYTQLGGDNRTVQATLSSYKPSTPLPDLIYATELNKPTTSFTASSVSGGSISKSGMYQSEVSFNAYDSYGNIAEQQKTGDAKHAYLWDYKGAYPVAEVTNSDKDKIAYTSFEADGTGNWTGISSGSVATSSTAPTGSKYYTLTGSTIQKSGLNASNTYIISYWSSTGDYYSVSGTVSASRKGATINGWTYCEAEVTGATTIGVSGTGNIDELRLYPKGALMITRSYLPLAGVSSECDASNKVTYYEYDSMGRVITIKDKDRNILKSFDYKYQQ